MWPASWVAAAAAVLSPCVVGSGTTGTTGTTLPTIAIIMCGDPDHLSHSSRSKKTGHYNEPLAQRPARFARSMQELAAMARPSLFYFKHPECSAQDHGCRAQEAASPGKSTTSASAYDQYVTVPALEHGEVSDRCPRPLVEVYDGRRYRMSSNVQMQNLWCAFLMMERSEAENGAPYDFVARVRPDFEVWWERSWLENLARRPDVIAGAIDTLMLQRKVPSPYELSCTVDRQHWATWALSSVFFLGARRAMGTIVAASRNVTAHDERHMTLALWRHNLTFAPVNAGQHKDQCRHCQFTMFVTQRGISCMRPTMHTKDNSLVLTCRLDQPPSFEPMPKSFLTHTLPVPAPVPHGVVDGVVSRNTLTHNRSEPQLGGFRLQPTDYVTTTPPGKPPTRTCREANG